MTKKGEPDDPKGLLYEAYRIEGITKPECRTIFLDWALSLPDGTEPAPVIERLLSRYGPAASAHPMTEVLTEGLARSGPPKRRGGWRSRPRGPA
ncbi:MAG: hypothetical protein AAGM84_05395 [Pseudomonadota bacterium]